MENINESLSINCSSILSSSKISLNFRIYHLQIIKYFISNLQNPTWLGSKNLILFLSKEKKRKNNNFVHQKEHLDRRFSILWLHDLSMKSGCRRRRVFSIVFLCQDYSKICKKTRMFLSLFLFRIKFNIIS